MKRPALAGAFCKGERPCSVFIREIRVIRGPNRFSVIIVIIPLWKSSGNGLVEDLAHLVENDLGIEAGALRAVVENADHRQG